MSNTAGGDNPGAMKWWKRYCNGKIRRCMEDSISKVYKKVNDPWNAPNDGKHYWDDPKGTRK